MEGFNYNKSYSGDVQMIDPTTGQVYFVGKAMETPIYTNKPYETIRDNGETIKFAKLKEEARIPSKNLEDAGYDIYACFNEDYLILHPAEIKLIPTGICSAFSEDFVMVLKERGSTGTKGLSVRAGIIDSGFRGMWQVPINNTSDSVVIISKKSEEETKDWFFNDLCSWEFPYDVVVYPYTKAICQALLLPVPRVEIEEISLEELQSIPSKRGDGMLGSSGK